eukprot:m.707614 g.707614  ORF g.707614 m.707614 type:complete len:81 (-) comp22935_c0_seq66:3897-4139(-)
MRLVVLLQTMATHTHTHDKGVTYVCRYIRDSSGCNAVTGVAAEQSVCVVGSTVVTVPGYKSPTCDSLEALGFGKRYWWIN